MCGRCGGRVLTPEQVSDLLQVSEKTVLNWLRTGKIPGRKVGRLWRISEEAILVFLQGDNVGTGKKGKRDA